LASSILVNDKAFGDEQGFAMNWAGMNKSSNELGRDEQSSDELSSDELS
jgi:hypothetical protein